VSRARCAILSKDKKPTLGYPEYVWQTAVASGQEDCLDNNLYPIHFDTRVDKWISVMPSFETPNCVIYKFCTFVFNKVLRGDELGEVGNVYMV